MHLLDETPHHFQEASHNDSERYCIFMYFLGLKGRKNHTLRRSCGKSSCKKKTPVVCFTLQCLTQQEAKMKHCSEAMVQIIGLVGLIFDMSELKSQGEIQHLDSYS